MTRGRSDGLYLMSLGSVVFLLLGTALAIGSSHPISDFRFVYNSARCLVQHVDPYKRTEFLRVFQADGGDLGSGNMRRDHLEMAQHMYLPTSFIIVPFALLPWAPAIVLWTNHPCRNLHPCIVPNVGISGPIAPPYFLDFLSAVSWQAANC